MRRRLLISSLGCILMGVSVFAQTRLEDKLQGVNDLRAIMEIVDQHYTDLQRQGIDRLPGEPKWKHWQRWAWYMSSRLGENGEFVDISRRLSGAHARMQHTHPVRSTVSDWSFIGPSLSTYANSWGVGNGIGRVDRVVFHPSDANTIYIGTPAGGLWRTTDGGTTWEPLTDFLPSTGISGIVVSHANPNVLYILTGDGDSNIPGGFVNDWAYIRPSIGVLKSTDGGTTWNQTGTLTNNTFYGFRLIQDPNDADILFAATSTGIFRTTNGGDTWQNVRGGKHYDIAFKPGDSDRVYATKPGGVRYSVNGGTNWNLATLDSTINSNGRVELAVTPDDPTVVYLIAGPRIDSTMFNGIFRSTDSGENYVQMTNAPNILSGASDGIGDGDQSQYDLAICASPTNSDHIFTGGVIIWKSLNGGMTVANVTTLWEDPGETWYVHPDVHDLAFNPLNNHLYAATDGGLYVSTNLGFDWTDLSEGIETTQIYHMTGVASDFNRLLIGNQDNGVKLRTANNANFMHLNSGDGFDGSFVAGDPSQFYVTVNTGVDRYWNNGLNRTAISPGTGTWYNTVVAHIVDPNMVFVGSDTVFRSPDQGATWDTLGASGTWAIATAPSNGNRLYTAGAGWFGPSPNGRVYRSDNTGTSWDTISLNPGFPSSFNKVTDLAVRPTNSFTIWASFGGFSNGTRVVRSTDGGANWTDMSGTLPAVPVNCLAVDDDGSAYAGTDLGVFYRAPSMSDWIPFSNHLPVVPVTDIVIYNTELRVSTFGRGVWKSPKPNTCSVAIGLSGSLSGDQYHEASFSISSDAVIEGGVGTWVAFKAGDQIQMTPGFNAKSGNVFKAYLGTCASGGVPTNE
ncbi:MAG: hypothetical protein R3301_07510 [Saprospiraceae bacterium]|nr:hypothetical protein [Saprospiraceae bacterium]